jgi:aminopeptidase N
MIMIQNFYPVVPVYDDEGWNVEIPPQNGDVTYFDASFYIARLTAPAELTVITSGTTLESEEQDGQRVIVFAAGPVRDIYIAASENFVATTGTVGETRVVSYSLEEFERGSHTALEVAMSALKSFDDRFGVYPYTEFELVSTPMQALGMEYPGVVAVAINLYDPESELGGVQAEIYLESTVAHEVAHQWFFNVVGSDQIDEPWLDEAVVQYATMLYYQDVHGDSGAAGFRQSWLDRWDRVDREEIPIGMPVARYDGREYGAIVYGRGPLFLEALRETMGDVAFDEFLRSYYTTYKWDLATSAGFRALAEQACGCDLTAPFEAWVFFD